MLTSSAGLVNGKLAQTTPTSGSMEGDGPVVASGRGVRKQIRNVSPLGHNDSSIYGTNLWGTTPGNNLFSLRSFEQKIALKTYGTTGGNAQLRSCRGRARYLGTIPHENGQQPQSAPPPVDRATYTERTLSRGDSRYWQYPSQPPLHTLVRTFLLHDGHPQRARASAKFSPGHVHGSQSSDGPQPDYPC